MKVLWLVLFSALHFGASLALDLHLEGADAGFFFQQSLGSSQQPLLKFPAHSYSSNASSSADPPPLLRERLAVLGPSAQPGRILVTYGPFEAKQSLPTKYLTLPLENATEGGEQATLMDVTAHVVNTELRRETPVLRVLFHSGRHFHSPGHIVEDDPDRGAANPSAAAAAAEEWEDEPNGRLMETCIALRVHNPNGGAPLTGTCAPQGLDGVCLAYLTLPFDWWASSPISPTFPSLNAGILGLQQHPTVTAKPSKAVRNVVELSYAVYETKAGQCGHSDPSTSNVGRVGHQKSQQQQQQRASSANSFPPPSAVLIQPSRPIGSVRLLPNVYAPRDLLVHEEVISLSPTLRFIASAAPLYPHSYFYVTVLLDSTTAKEEPYAVIVRAKVKNGLKIISTQTTNPAWSLSFDVNGKHIAAAVSAVRNFSVSTQPHQPSQELFTWLLAVNVDHHRDSSELGDGVRALWSWTIRTHSASPPLPSSISGHHHHANNKEGQLDEVKGKLTSRFEVLKDEVQSVFPIIKRRDLVNTAILTSRQVSEPLRVFMVTQAGKVADVTLQATCSSADESVLKVSSSCTSVYLDGSEVRGSTNATLVARYGNVESTSSLTVWVPEMPLDIQLDDVKLNQISGWKVMASAASGGSANQCRLRYQQSSFEVFARFYAEDHDSGRVSYLISRKTYLLITDLVRKVMRVADPRVASLKMTSGFIEGLKPGKTEVQVLSPMSGHVIAARELRVLADKVDVSSLSVRLIAGLSLSLSPDPDLDSCFVAQVEASDRLHSRYQEAILDLTVHFSDGSASPLRLTDRSHYNLVVESHNTSILALTSPARANIPRVLALGEGRATLSVTFSSACTTTTGQTVGGDGIGDASHHRQVPAHPLATTMTVIQLALTGHPATSVQNDARTESSSQLYTLPQGGHGNGNQIIGDSRRNGGGGGGKVASAAAAATGRLAQPNQGQLTFSKPGSIEFGVNENQLSLKDDSNAVMMSNAGRELHQHPAYPSHYPGSGGFGSFSSSSFQHMGPLEIGMYVLLAIFCAAIVVFVGTCIVYASRARKGLIPTDDSDQHIDRQPPTIDPWPSLWNRLKKMNPKGGGGGGSDEQRGRGIAGEENEDEEEGTDKGWIWLGRSTLDPEVPRRQTRPLSATGAARPVSTNAAAAADVSANRLSGISYTGSEVSVRIVGRASGQDGGRLSYKAQLCFEPLKDAADDDDDDIDHDAHHPNSWPGSVDSKTFTKASNSSQQQQQELLHHHPGALRIITNQLAAAEEPLLLSDVVRRPSNNRRAARRASEQDTRRYARSWLMAGEAVPRDFNSNPSILMDSSDAEEEEEEEEEEIQDLGCHVPDAFPNAKKNLKLDLSGIDKKTDSEYNVATFLRHGSPDIKQANIIENPRFSPTAVTSVEVENDDGELSAVGGESVESHPSAASALDVDYDRIISYLGILKETST